MSNSVIASVPANMLFRYAIPCRQLTSLSKEPVELPPENALPNFGQFENQAQFAELRAAWNSAGLFFHLLVTGKKKPPFCRPTQLLESDSLHVWIDTRDTHNVHRATRFCHWFVILPTGGATNRAQPISTMLKINRAKEDSPAINRGKIVAASKIRTGGYDLCVYFPVACLQGWNPADHRNVGFSYAVIDHEFGWQTLAAGPEMPIREDPSLWHTLRLVDEKA